MSIAQATLQFVKEHRNDDVKALLLQASRYPDVDMRSAVQQIEGWQHAVAKLPEWAATEGILYPPRLSMEQCSSEPTALYKASIMAGGSFADMTGGFGIDCSYISRNFLRGFFIERSEELCKIAAHNFSLLGLHHIEVLNGNSEEKLPTLPSLDWIYIDPARRDIVGKKVVALSDCEPDVVAIKEQLLAKAGKVMIKCSPMLDITAACRQLGCVGDVHIVSVNNECKELLFILSAEQSVERRIHCVNIHGGDVNSFSFSSTDDAVCSYSAAVGRYLFEPNASIQKAGCPATLAAEYGLKKLHNNSNLYTSDEPVSSFPGRAFEVVEVCGFSKAELKAFVGDLKKANIAVRNFPESVQQLRKRLKLGEGGDAYIFATTLANDKRVLVRCRKLY